MKTDREFYYPGNTVLGKIYIRSTPGHKFIAKDLSLRIKGYEKAKFTAENDEGELCIRRRFHKTIIDWTATLPIDFEAAQQMYLGGDFSVPFEFTLPSNIPASLEYRDLTHFEKKPKARVQYTIKVKLGRYDSEKEEW